MPPKRHIVTTGRVASGAELSGVLDNRVLYAQKRDLIKLDWNLRARLGQSWTPVGPHFYSRFR